MSVARGGKGGRGLEAWQDVIMVEAGVHFASSLLSGATKKSVSLTCPWWNPMHQR